MRFAIRVAALSGLAAQDQSAYVIRLGQDTVGLERYTRTATD